MLYEVITNNEGAKFWLNIVTELKNRGVNDIIIACVDGLKGFPEAIQTVFPETQVHRITSYNVCYTKLLRSTLLERPGKLTRLRQLKKMLRS